MLAYVVPSARGQSAAKLIVGMCGGVCAFLTPLGAVVTNTCECKQISKYYIAKLNKYGLTFQKVLGVQKCCKGLKLIPHVIRCRSSFPCLLGLRSLHKQIDESLENLICINLKCSQCRSIYHITFESPPLKPRPWGKLWM